MSKPITSFFGITDCILKKTPIPTDAEINKHCSVWMINMQMSCCEQLTQLAHELSKVKLTNKDYFDFCYYGIPKMNVFIKYTAQKAKKDQEVKWIAEHFGCNIEHAKQYMQLLQEKEKEEIFEGFTNRGIMNKGTKK
jgi:hypothetical protein